MSEFDFTELEASLFEAAAAVDDREQRRKLLDAACHDKPDLRSRIEQLLAADEIAGEFMQQPAVEFTDETIDSLPVEKPGSIIGRYKLLEQIGEGGFGVVYMADQLRPIKRRVALKIIKLGMDTKQVVARFEAERQALALMDHPNIAKIFDAGTTDSGRPYFVMELVRGIPVTEYCDDRNLTAQQRLKLFSQICLAVQHAHQKGIIHRDIKPNNILVGTNGDVAVPKVIDFGIAKATQGRLTDKTLFTHFRQFIGTPAYMSPEQAQMSAVDVDTRSDIYSLGVLLYELLTGQTPLESKSLVDAGYEEIFRRIREEEALKPSRRISSLHKVELTTLAKNRKTAPSQFTASVRGDLDWIVMKAVEKDRARRYESCGSLVADIDRYLNNEPVNAGPPSAIYYVRKFFQRHRVAALTTLAFATILLLGTIGSVAGWRQAAVAKNKLAGQVTTTQQALDESNESRVQAQQASQELSRRMYQIHLAGADRALLTNDFVRARAELDACPSENRLWEWQFLDERFRVAFPAIFLSSSSPIFSDDGKRLYSIGKAGTSEQRTIGIWDPSSGNLLKTLPSELGLRRITLSPSEKLLAGSDGDGSQFVMKIDTGKVLWSAKDYSKRFAGMTFSPDGQLLVSANSEDREGIVVAVAAHSGERQFAIPTGRPVRGIKFSPDGRWLGIGGSNQSEPPLLIDFDERQVTKSFPEGHTTLAFHPQNDEIATGSRTGTITVWQWDGGELNKLRDWQAATAIIRSLNYSSDGTRLVSGDEDNGVTVWEPNTGTKMARTDAGDIPWSVMFNPSQREQVAFSTQSSGIRLWHYGEHEEGMTLKPIKSNAIARFSQDGRQVAVSLRQHWGNGEAPVSILDAVSGKPVTEQKITQPLHTASWIDGRHVAAGVNSLPEIRVFDTITGELTGIFKGFTDYAVRRVSAFEDHLVAVFGDGTIGSWDMKATGESSGDFFGNVDHQFGLYGIDVSRDNTLVAVAFWEENTIEIWDVRTKKQIHTLSVPNQIPESISFVKDASSVYVGSNGGLLTKIELASGQETGRYLGHTREVVAIALAPDESQFVSGDSAGKVIVWDAETAQPVITLTDGGQPIRSVDWSPDGRRIVAGNADGTIQIWTVR